MSKKHSRPIWIKDVRLDWSIKRIKHATYLKARVGWHGLTSSEYLNQGVLLVTGTDFENGQINWESCYRVSEERYQQDPYIQLQEGDLLITKDGTIGKVALVEGLNEPATLNSGIFVTRPLKGIYTNQFMYWLLKSKIFQTFIDYIKVGTTINHLYQNQLSDFAFPAPSLETQKTIATFLDRKTAAIDALIAKKQRLIELLEEKRTSLINHAVTKGLNPNVEMKDSGVPWIGEIPEHWGVLHLKRVIASSDYGISAQLEPIGIYPVLRMGNLQNGKVEMDNLKFVNEVNSQLILKPDDILFNRTNSLDLVGKVALFRGYAKAKVTYASYLVRFRTNQLAYPEYLVMFLGRKEVQRVARAMALPAIGQVNLNPNRYGYLRICLPPLSEQITISTWLTNKLTQLQQPINQINLQIEKLQEYRQSLITAAVTGKININEEEIA